VSYVVNWRGSDGQAGWHPVDDVAQAAAQVEHLRNVDGVDAIKIFQLDEIAFEFRPYYRVELATPTPAPDPVATDVAWAEPEDVVVPEPVPVAEVAAEPVEAAPVAEPAPVPVSSVPQPAMAEVGAEEPVANGQRRGLFGR
jgi:hypothetical protein